MGDDDKSDEELAAEQELLQAIKGKAESEDFAEKTVAAWKDLLKTRGQREGVDEERDETIKSALDAMGRAMKLAVPPPVSRTEPADESERFLRSLGVRPVKEIQAEIDALRKGRDAMRRVMEGFADVIKTSRRSTKLAEALPYLRRLEAALTNIAIRAAGPDQLASRLNEALVLLGNCNRDLQKLESSEALDRLKSDRLYPGLAMVRRVLMEGHTMVVRPEMGRASGQPAANRVRFLGTPARRSALEPCLQRLGLILPKPRRGGDEVENRWGEMLDAYLVVCDLSDCRPPIRHEVCYQLGWARALGRPLVVLTDPSEPLPFNIDLQPIDANDVSAVEDAVFDCLFEPSTVGIVRTACTNTAAELIRRYQGTRDSFIRGEVDSLVKEVEDGAHDGLIHDRIRSLVRADPAAKLDIITPTWPPSYPVEGATRMFHVMPYSEDWSGQVSQAAEAGAGAAYTIHKDVDDEHIISSMWKEIAVASHVLVDVTTQNDNVMIELGMAHVLGKKTRMVIQDSWNVADLHPLIRRRKVIPYKFGRLETLTGVVEQFLRPRG